MGAELSARPPHHQLDPLDQRSWSTLAPEYLSHERPPWITRERFIGVFYALRSLSTFALDRPLGSSRRTFGAPKGLRMGWRIFKEIFLLAPRQMSADVHFHRRRALTFSSSYRGQRFAWIVLSAPKHEDNTYSLDTPVLGRIFESLSHLCNQTTRLSKSIRSQSGPYLCLAIDFLFSWSHE